MEISEILTKCDHTLLSQTATWEDIKNICDDGIKYHTASVCIPPCYVKMAKEYAKGKVKICTVIGFPNGYSETAIKAEEARLAVANGADEIDMVINVGYLKAGHDDMVLAEINEVKSKCDGRILKVIVETCFLTEEEKIRVCEIVSNSDADFIKTSTGFGTGGATKEDIRLFSAKMKNGKKIKAAGGISSIEDARTFIQLGADRLGTSKVVKILKSESDDSKY